MIANYNIDITDFVKITSAGIFVADYSQIRAALVQRYQSIYGSDIDLSTGSADGVWIADQALIINNMCQVIKNLYSNLDVNSASGIYLDALCRLSNVTRRKATRSTVNVSVTFESDNVGETKDFAIGELQVIDQSGIIWSNGTELLLSANVPFATTLICDENGEITAPKGWIKYSIVQNVNLTIEQLDDAVVGLTEESDDELRARRSLTNALNGVTVLESLVSALLNVSGVKDVKIYNNNTSAPFNAKDGTSVDVASVYIILRKREELELDSSVICSTIYHKLTPGIRTIASAVSSMAKSASFVPSVNEMKVTLFSQAIYWKEAKGLNPDIVITITPNNNFSIAEFDDIVSSSMKMLNEQALSIDMDLNEVQAEIMYSDPLFKGNRTYVVKSVTRSNPTDPTDPGTTNPDQYYNYTKYFIKANGTITYGTNTIIIENGSFTLNNVVYTLYNNCIIDSNNITTQIKDNTFELNNTIYRINITSVTKDTNDYTITLK